METIIPMIVTTADGVTAQALWYGSTHKLEVIDAESCEATADWKRRWIAEASDFIHGVRSADVPGVSIETRYPDDPDASER